MQRIIDEGVEPGTGQEPAGGPGLMGADMLVLVQGSRGRELYGSVAHTGLPEPVPYGNIRELLLALDAIGRRLGLSSPEGGLRTLGGGTGGGRGGPRPERKRDMEEEREQEGGDRDGESRFLRQLYAGRPREFFQLRLTGMHNSSLQGSLRGRLTGGRYVYFRSALELMSMLSAVRLPGPEDRLTMRNESHDR